MSSNPGSPDAKRLGCTCPVIDNNYGNGAVVDGQVIPDQFYIDPDCAIHRDRRSVEGSGNAQSADFWTGFTARMQEEGRTIKPEIDQQ